MSEAILFRLGVDLYEDEFLPIFVFAALFSETVSATGMSDKAHANNNSYDLTMRLWINLYGENDNTTAPPPVTCADNSEELQELRIIVLLVIGIIGAFIVGALLFCMLYKNERILQTIPGTKEYERRRKEPEYFYPIPRLGAIKTIASQGKSVAYLTNPKLLESGIINGDTRAGIKIKLTDMDGSNRECNKLEIDASDGKKSDESSFNESDGLDDECDNTFPAGGDRETKNKKRTKKPGKRVRRLRKKNKYSKTLLVKSEWICN